MATFPSLPANRFGGRAPRASLDRDFRTRRSWGIVLALVIASAAVLGGCATTLETQVTSFHEAQTAWPGKRFVIVAGDDQRDSLEFRAYSDLVSRALQAKGLVPASAGGADVEVRLQYRSSEQRPVVYGAPIYGYGAFGPAWGFSGYPHRGGVYFGWYPYWGSYGVIASDYHQYRTWRRELRVEIHAPGKSARLYEGTSFNDGRGDALPAVMPALVEAMFHDFPGPNGQVRRVEVELREPASAPPATVPARPAQSSGAQTPSK